MPLLHYYSLLRFFHIIFFTLLYIMTPRTLESDIFFKTTIFQHQNNILKIHVQARARRPHERACILKPISFLCPAESWPDPMHDHVY